MGFRKTMDFSLSQVGFTRDFVVTFAVGDYVQIIASFRKGDHVGAAVSVVR